MGNFRIHYWCSTQLQLWPLVSNLYMYYWAWLHWGYLALRRFDSLIDTIATSVWYDTVIFMVIMNENLGIKLWYIQLLNSNIYQIIELTNNVLSWCYSYGGVGFLSSVKENKETPRHSKLQIQCFQSHTNEIPVVVVMNKSTDYQLIRLLS